MYQLIDHYLGTLLNILSIIIFGKIIDNKKIKIKKTYFFIFLFCASILLELAFYCNFTVFRTEIFFCTYVILIKYIYLQDLMKSIILVFYYFIILVISDIICIVVYSNVFGKDIFYNMIAGSFLGNFIVFILMIVFTLILKKIINNFLNIKIQYGVLIASMPSLYCIIKIFYLTFSKNSHLINEFLCICCILVIILLLGYYFFQVYQNNQILVEYDRLLSFMKKYEAEIDNQRIIRHESTNQLLTIKSKIIDNEDNASILKYIDEVINDKKKVKHSEYAKLVNLPSNGIKGLFYFKISLAEDKNIKVSINISSGINKSFLSNLDPSMFNQIAKILGVYLDNAIEAAELTLNKMIGIEVYLKDNGIQFVISNTYNNKISRLGKSTKGNNRGHGLILANNIIRTNEKLNTSVETIDDLYIVKFSVKE